MVNLNLAHKLLVTANEQPSGFLNVRRADLVREVELIAAAGLVDASLGNSGSGPFAVINRVTEQGHAFLRAFKEQPSRVDRTSARSRGTVTVGLDGGGHLDRRRSDLVVAGGSPRLFIPGLSTPYLFSAT